MLCYAECHYAEYTDCHYAECRYAECHYAECRGADIIGFKMNTNKKMLDFVKSFEMNLSKVHEYVVIVKYK